jgi:arylsulfatase A-like enzyme
VDSGDGPLASLLDIAPTVLHALDEPIPTEMDGNPLTDAFLREFNSNRRVRRQPLADLVADVDREAGSPDGVREQLSDLGYL